MFCRAGNPANTPGTKHIWRDDATMSRNTAAARPRASQLTAAADDDDDDGANDTLFSFSDAIAAAERDSPRLSPDLLDDFFLSEASFRVGHRGGSSNGLRGGGCSNGQVTKHVAAAAAPLPRPSSMSGVCATPPATAAWRFTKLPWIGRHSISSTPCSLTAASSAFSLP